MNKFKQYIIKKGNFLLLLLFYFFFRSQLVNKTKLKKVLFELEKEKKERISETNLLFS